MTLTLTIDDTLWSYGVAQSAADGSDINARCLQYVNEYLEQCGGQQGLSPDAKLGQLIASLDAAGKTALLAQATKKAASA